MDKMIIKRQAEWYRPYFINDIELKNIIFYNKNGIVLQVKYGFIEEYFKRDILSYGGDLIALGIDTPKKANKVNFDRQDNFYITVNDYTGKKYNLYINTNNINIELSGTEKKEISEGYYHIYNIYKLTCKNGCYVIDSKNNEKDSFYICNFDKVEQTDKTTEYDTVRNNIKEKYYVDIYSIEKARQVYTELKKFFDKYEKGYN